MLRYFQNVRPGLERAIGEILRENAPKLGSISPLGTQLVARLESYARSGKMIRGILVRLGYELCAAEAPDAAMDVVLDRAGAAEHRREALQKAEVLWTICLMDTECPPSTQYAAYNKITAKKSMLTYPDFGHEPALPGMRDLVFQFMLGL